MSKSYDYSRGFLRVEKAKLRVEILKAAIHHISSTGEYQVGQQIDDVIRAAEQFEKFVCDPDKTKVEDDFKA